MWGCAGAQRWGGSREPTRGCWACTVSAPAAARGPAAGGTRLPALSRAHRSGLLAALPSHGVTHLAPAPSPRAPMEGNSEAMACGERALAVPLAVPPSCLPSAGSPSPALWKAAAGERREPRPGAPQIMRCLCGDGERSAPDNRLLFSCLFSCVRTACAAGSRGSWSTPSPALTPKHRAKSSRGCWWGWERRAPEAPRGFVQLWPVLAERPLRVRFWCCPREMGCSAPAQQLLLPGDEKIHWLSMTQLFGGVCLHTRWSALGAGGAAARPPCSGFGPWGTRRLRQRFLLGESSLCLWPFEHLLKIGYCCESSRERLGRVWPWRCARWCRAGLRHPVPAVPAPCSRCRLPAPLGAAVGWSL